jgi:hypothetical protein
MFTESAVKDLESKLNPKIEAKEKQKW